MKSRLVTVFYQIQPWQKIKLGSLNAKDYALLQGSREVFFFKCCPSRRPFLVWSVLGFFPRVLGG